MIQGDDREAKSSKGIENINVNYNIMWVRLLNVNKKLTSFSFKNAKQNWRP